MDRRVAIIRFWLLCIASLAVAVCWPQIGVGLWPVLFFLPNCTCCGLSCATACDTGTTPSAITFVTTGFANDTNCTTCNELDGTFVIPIRNVSPYCTGRLTPITFTCSPGTGVGTADYTWSVFAGDSYLGLSFSVGSGLQSETYSLISAAIGTAPITCNTISSLALSYQTQSGLGDFCEASGATATATA